MTLVQMVKLFVPPILWGVIKWAQRKFSPLDFKFRATPNDVHIRFGLRDLRVELGCGPTPKEERITELKNYIGIDLFFPESADIVLDLAISPLPFHDETVAKIYSSHCLEHIPFKQLKYSLSEAYRVLQRGGGIRIVLPDLTMLAQAYTRGDYDCFDRFHVEGETLGDRFNYAIRMHGHQWMYDFASLKWHLEAAGFVDVEESEWDDTIDSSFPTQSFFTIARKP